MANRYQEIEAELSKIKADKNKIAAKATETLDSLIEKLNKEKQEIIEREQSSKESEYLKSEEFFLDAAKLAFRINAKGKYYCFFEQTAHCHYFRVEITPSSDYNRKLYTFSYYYESTRNWLSEEQKVIEQEKLIKDLNQFLIGDGGERSLYQRNDGLFL